MVNDREIVEYLNRVPIFTEKDVNRLSSEGTIGEKEAERLMGEIGRRQRARVFRDEYGEVI